MDLLQANVKRCYFRYLRAAFGSALISSVYSMADMAMVGQYQGPDGIAALAVVAPVWNIIYSLGLLAGIGGCVLGSAAKGRGDERTKNEYFTAACICAGVLAAASWAAVLLWQTPMLRAFGADGTLLSIARQYLQPIRFAVPLFLINQMLAAWLRNDGAPVLATAAVLAGGVFNIFGDYAFVFLLDTGAWGAGLATALGAAISFAVMLGHFFSKKNTLRLVRPARLAGKLRKIVTAGFSTFFIDIAMGLLTMLFNRQIMRWLGADALAVYGVIVNVSTFVQCCAYSVGQAAQPIISVNFGARQWGRIRQTLHCALCAAAFFSIVWTALVFAFPHGFVRIFMAPTPQILRIAPFILRSYGISFLLLPLNIFSTYYFQALMKPGAAFFVSVARGLVLSGALILLLPALVAPNALWLAMPVTEAVVAAAAAVLMARYTRALGTSAAKACEKPA